MSQDYDMTRAEIEDLATRRMRLWQLGGIGDFDVLHSAQFADHSPAGRKPDRHAFRDGILDLYELFPDFGAMIQFIAVDEPHRMATVRWSATARDASFRPTAVCDSQASRSSAAVTARSSNAGVDGTALRIEQLDRQLDETGRVPPPPI